MTSQQEFLNLSKFMGITIIWQEIEQVSRALQDHTTTGFAGERNSSENYKLEQSPLDFDKVHFGRPAYRASLIEMCIYEPICSLFWCVWVANILDGWSSLLRVLCKKNNWSAVTVRSSSSDQRDWIQELKIIRGGEVIRCVRSMWDDERPAFFSSGTPLFFEKTELYKEIDIKDRVTRKSLGLYLLAMGLPVLSPEFWISRDEAIYFSRGHNSQKE